MTKCASTSVVTAIPDLERPLILFVGNMIEGKGQEVAIAAFNRIAGLYPNARLRFVGGDMGLEKNRNFAARMKQEAADGPASDRIEFVGATDDVAPHYAAAFAALNCSESESFSITCLDGSAAGLPVVATRCGGPEEIVEDGKTGFLVPVGDSQGGCRTARLAARPIQPRRRRWAVQGARLVAERFSPERARGDVSGSVGALASRPRRASPRSVAGRGPGASRLRPRVAGPPGPWRRAGQDRRSDGSARSRH